MATFADLSVMASSTSSRPHMIPMDPRTVLSGGRKQDVTRLQLSAPLSGIAAWAILVLLMGAMAPASAQERIGAVSTTFRLIGPNDKVVVDRYDDPKVENAACYVSRAETGGISGAVG